MKFSFLIKYIEFLTVSTTNQKICNKVEASAASIGNNDCKPSVEELRFSYDKVEDSITNVEPTGNMSAIKTTGSGGGTRVLPVFSHVKYEHLIAGLSGGVVSTLMLHPLDLIKIRFAVNDGVTHSAPQYSGLTGAFREIRRTEGLKGLYRGVVPNILGSGSSWGLYFFFYNTIKTWIQGGNAKKPVGPLMHIVAAAEAGILTLLITNPIWVVKTRLCLQYASDVNLAENKRYSGLTDALSKIYRTEGIRGLYKGLVPGLFGVSHGALQFMTYEEMKNSYNNYRGVPIDTKLDTTDYICFAALSKLFAAMATYPYQVVRARLQDHHHDYRGTWHCIQLTWRREGWRGFYKGLGPNLVRVVPATVITFVTYENVSHKLLRLRSTSIEDSRATNVVAIEQVKN